eukprot:285756-Alexandrium_andersonii.AAC.1
MVTLLQHIRIETDLRRQRRDEDMQAILRQGQGYLQHGMDVDSLMYFNERTFTKDSATAWQNLAQLRLEWNRVGGWSLAL